MNAAGGLGQGAPEPRPQLAGVVRILKSAGSIVEIEVVGSSMDAALPDRTMVRVDCSGTPVTRGSVVAFLAGGTDLTIHRAVTEPGRSRFMITRGDANLFCDPPLPVGDVVGLVVERLGTNATWEPIPGRAEKSGIAALLGDANAGLMTGALRLHVRLAQALALMSLASAIPRVLITRGRVGRPPLLKMLSLRRPT